MWAQDGPATKQEPAGTGPSDTLSSRQSQRHIPCAPGEQDAIRLSSGRRHPNTGRGIRGVNTKPRAGDGSRTRVRPARRADAGRAGRGDGALGRRAGPGRHWVPGFVGRARQPAAPSPGVQRAQGVRRRHRRFQGRPPGPRGPCRPPPASLSQALNPYKSIHSHLLQLPGSRAGSAATEQKTKPRKEGRVCQEKQPGPQGAVWGGQQPPPAGFRTKVPGQPGALLEAKWSWLEASAPHALGAPATGRTTPQASAAKVVPGSRTRRTEVEGRAPAALLPLRKNDARDPEAAAGPSAGLPQPAVPRATLWQRRENNQGGRTTRGPGEFGNQQPRRAHAAPGKRVTTLPKVTRHHALQAVVPHARPWPMRLRSSSTSVARGHSGGQRPR